MSRPPVQYSCGFTLIEVLVTLVILMFGLLGIAGLMAKGQKASFEAYQRQQALALASDMVERLMANPTQATVYEDAATFSSPIDADSPLYDDLISNTTTNCTSEVCDSTQLANYDLAAWAGLIKGATEKTVSGGNSVGGIVGARGCIEEISNTASTCPATGRDATPFYRLIRVSVAWQGQEDLGNNLAYPTRCGEGDYGTVGQRRVVTEDVNLQILCTAAP